MRKRITSLILTFTLSTLLLTFATYGQLDNVPRIPFIHVRRANTISLHASDDTDILIDAARPSVRPPESVIYNRQNTDSDTYLHLREDSHISGLTPYLRPSVRLAAHRVSQPPLTPTGSEYRGSQYHPTQS